MPSRQSSVCTAFHVIVEDVTSVTNTRPLEVCIMEYIYNLTQGLLGKSKLAQHVYGEGHKICMLE
jgi:hypothetical protein